MSHTRKSSRDSPPAGASYGLILEHVLSYPGSYELPLRTMYTLNCTSRAQPLPQNMSSLCTPAQSLNPSPTSSVFPECTAVQTATAQFTSALLNRIARLPSQPCSLPPVFINSFLRRCFHADLALVDFTQALTALDYLKDLETRRRREITSAFERLGVSRDRSIREVENFSESAPPAVVKWVESMEKSEGKVEALYTQIYVALRRWILINELSLTPFSRHNCLAMLNTLYPPTSTSRPTSKLTPEVLKRQRDTFFKYVQSVERKGVDVLKPLMLQNTTPGDENGWPRVRSILDNYLRVAMSLIDECMQITNRDELTRSNGGEQAWSKRQDGKVDSGVSFGTDEIHPVHAVDDRKRLRDSPEPAKDAPPAKKHYSTLERIAYELRKLRARTRSQASLRSADKEKSAEKDQECIEDKRGAGPLHEINGNSNNDQSMTDSAINENPPADEPALPLSPSSVIRRLRSLGDLKSLSRSNSSPPCPSRVGGVSTLISNGNEMRKDEKSLAERIFVVHGASQSFG